MPSKKKKYNARFPAGRIKKIMQTDEEVGKVAQAVPVIISRTLELFVESLLTKSMQITQSRNAKTLTPSHMKQCILSESRFDFLKDLVKNVPDATAQEDSENASIEALDYSLHKPSEVPPVCAVTETVKSEPVKQEPANSLNQQGTSNTPSVIQYGPKVVPVKETSKLNFSIESLVQKDPIPEPKIHIDLSHIVPTTSMVSDIPPLAPLTNNLYNQSTGDNLYIDEDYDN